MIALESNYGRSDRLSFIEGVKKYSYMLGIDPSWMMFLFDLESGLNPNIGNSIGCVGLSQFCPDTPGGSFKTVGGKRIDLNWYKNLSGSDQLPYIYEYFKSKAGQFRSFHDLYMFNLLPAFFQAQENALLPSWVVPDNPLFDVNKDGTISVKELYGYLDSRVRSRIPAQFHSQFFNNDGSVKSWDFIQRNQRNLIIGSFTVMGVILLGVIVYLILKK